MNREIERYAVNQTDRKKGDVRNVIKTEKRIVNARKKEDITNESKGKRERHIACENERHFANERERKCEKKRGRENKEF